MWEKWAKPTPGRSALLIAPHPSSPCQNATVPWAPGSRPCLSDLRPVSRRTSQCHQRVPIIGCLSSCRGCITFPGLGDILLPSAAPLPASSVDGCRFTNSGPCRLLARSAVGPGRQSDPERRRADRATPPGSASSWSSWPPTAAAASSPPTGSMCPTRARDNSSIHNAPQ